MSKISLDEIRSELQEQNWLLLSDKYFNLNTELQYQCNNGHIVYAPWKQVRNKFECPICKKNALCETNFDVKPKAKGTVRILSVDKATHKCGWAILDNKKLIAYGDFDVPDYEEYQRIHAIKEWLVSMINMWKPDGVALEGIQYQNESNGHQISVTVFQTLARLQGVLIEALVDLGLTFEVCPTNTWRHHCGVKGRSRVDRKRSMQFLIKTWYDVNVNDDIADAIGIGKYYSDKFHNVNVIENWE